MALHEAQQAINRRTAQAVKKTLALSCARELLIARNRYSSDYDDDGIGGSFIGTVLCEAIKLQESLQSEKIYTWDEVELEIYDLRTTAGATSTGRLCLDRQEE